MRHLGRTISDKIERDNFMNGFIKIEKIPIDPKTIVITDKTRLWCQLPYPDHPKGCPNFGKKDCSPNVPIMWDLPTKYDKYELRVLEFNLEEYAIQRRAQYEKEGKVKSEKQLRCSRYWQGTLKLAKERGFKISISMEPLIEPSIIDLGEAIAYFESMGITEIWIGAMNYTKDSPKYDYDKIYQKFKNDENVKWKESFRKHLKREIMEMDS